MTLVWHLYKLLIIPYFFVITYFFYKFMLIKCVSRSKNILNLLENNIIAILYLKKIYLKYHDYIDINSNHIFYLHKSSYNKMMIIVENLFCDI